MGIVCGSLPKTQTARSPSPGRWLAESVCCSGDFFEGFCRNSGGDVVVREDQRDAVGLLNSSPHIKGLK